MKKVLEILVDRQNQKGPIVFEQILGILHRVFEDYQTKKVLKHTPAEQLNFSFEISKIGNRIRFFIVVPGKYANFLQNQIYAHYTNVEILEVADYLSKIPNEKIALAEVGLKKHNYYSLKTFTEVAEGSSVGKDTIDPLSSITSALGRTGKYSLNSLQINFAPIKDNYWKKNKKKIIEILVSEKPEFIKKIQLSEYYIFLKVLLFPFILIGKLISIFSKNTENSEEGEKTASEKSEGEKAPEDYFKEKLEKPGFITGIRLVHAGEDRVEARGSIKEIFSTLSLFSDAKTNSFTLGEITSDYEKVEQVKTRTQDNTMILSSNELCCLVHLPTNYVKTPQINWIAARAFEPPSNLPIIDPDLTDDIRPESNLTPIGITNFRGTNMSFGIGPDDRRRHMYVLGKTGMGKSTLLENMIIDDMRKGRGVAVIDPHGDLVESVLGFVPKNRTNQVILFDPSDKDWPIAFNMLENVSPEHRPLIASGLVGIFKKIFGDSWGPRLEHILRNTILALLEYPNSTLMSIPLMLTSEVFRNKVVQKITDPVVKKFWTAEFAKMAPNQKVEAAGPILNKVGQFLSSSILRNVLGQPKNSFSVRWAMDNKKIVLVNLSKGKIGEDASSLLGAMMVTKFQLDAMSRADISESQRQDFYLYVDEFQNFATDSFSTILSEARKYRLNLVMANQFIDQMTEGVRGAVFGNVGSMVSFQVGYHDATILKEVLSGEIEEDDLMNLKKYTIYIKELINGMPSSVFSAATFAPNPKNELAFKKRYDKILKVSREKYTMDRKKVEQKIYKTINDLDQQEQAWEKRKEDMKKKEQERKRKEREKREEEAKKKRESKN